MNTYLSFFFYFGSIVFVGSLLFNNLYPKFGDIPLLNRKTFGAKRVNVQEHSYVASVRWKFSHYIPGTILTRNCILTTAWPLHNVPTHELFVIGGETYADRGTLQHTVLLVIVHEHFSPQTLKNDIAILRLYEDIDYTSMMKAISIAPFNSTLDGKTAFVTGWGRCDFTGKELCFRRSSTFYKGELLDPMMKTVKFTIRLPEYYCEGYIRHGLLIYKGSLCLGVAREDDPVAPCMGVPGAPLIIGGDLVGILSWGLGCGYARDLPLIYTDVRYYNEWILSVLEIMAEISTDEALDELYSLYRACRFYEVMTFMSRDYNKNYQPEADIYPLLIDHTLCKLNATIYDVRDYFNNGSYSFDKQNTYGMLKLKALTNSTA